MQSFRDSIQKTRGTLVVEKHTPESLSKASLLTITGRFPTLKEADVYLVEEAMRRASSNQGVAATLLGITRQSLNRRLKNMSSQ